VADRLQQRSLSRVASDRGLFCPLAPRKPPALAFRERQSLLRPGLGTADFPFQPFSACPPPLLLLEPQASRRPITVHDAIIGVGWRSVLLCLVLSRSWVRHSFTASVALLLVRSFLRFQQRNDPVFTRTCRSSRDRRAAWTSPRPLNPFSDAYCIARSLNAATAIALHWTQEHQLKTLHDLVFFTTRLTRAAGHNNSSEPQQESQRLLGA
jgi:hypothetical protein